MPYSVTKQLILSDVTFLRHSGRSVHSTSTGSITGHSSPPFSAALVTNGVQVLVAEPQDGEQELQSLYSHSQSTAKTCKTLQNL